MVLDRPKIPLHTNGSERDIRCHVIERKISDHTRSHNGRDCPDAFLALMHTCTKLGIAFWDHLGARLLVPHTQIVPYLPELSAAAVSPPEHCHHRFCPGYPISAPAAPHTASSSTCEPSPSTSYSRTGIICSAPSPP